MKNKVLFLRGPYNRQFIEVEIDEKGKPKEKKIILNTKIYTLSSIWTNQKEVWFYRFNGT